MQNTDLSALLLKWYAEHGRDLPWRVKGGAHSDPYVILVSEFMLQQTGVKTVIPYFHRFMERFPTVASLADATADDVYLYWQGLGYYSRARSLHAAAKMIMTEYGGHFPTARVDVLKLPGIGPYTAASFLALAFNQPETVVDGNVIRVICRLYHLTEPAAEIMDEIRARAVAITHRDHAADYASAIMDLGATVCTPKNPACGDCPWQKQCLARAAGDAADIPSLSRPAQPSKTGRVYVITNRRGAIFIRKRPGTGLLSGLYEFPWIDNDAPMFKTGAHPTKSLISLEPGATDTGATVTHTFTHFKLKLKIQTMTAERIPLDGQFVRPGDLADYPMSTLMKKVFNGYMKTKESDRMAPRLAL
ncbi:MAG: A/G-specific adenine glycosylase [Proteobacteria bacterium]|nr:A/G-specific adenine glycosylase [Pseudomonadota bacterium]